MHSDIKINLIAALKSGAYKQGCSRLRTASEHYCPLGVVADLYSRSHTVAWEQPYAGDYFILGYNEKLPEEIMQWAGLDEQECNDIITANDNGMSFEDICDLVITTESECEQFGPEKNLSLIYRMYDAIRRLSP